MFDLVQTELNRYNSVEYDHNGRYELCFDVQDADETGILPLEGAQTLTLTNTTPLEVVIGFLKARRTDTSSAPLVEIHGSRVTLFQAEFANAAVAVQMEGNEHQIVGGSISASAEAVRLSGVGHRVEGIQVTGNTGAVDCLKLVEASEVEIESNEFSHCHKGIHVVDSNAIYIGPEAFADFETGKNEIHHNTYAIHAEQSQQVFARHNAVYENGFETEDQDEAYRFGLWLVESNLIFNGESQILPSPKMDPADEGDVEREEYPVVKYDNEGNAFIDVEVPVQAGRVELYFPYSNQIASRRFRHQPHTPFVDCAFTDVSIDAEDGTGTVRCPIDLNEEAIGKKVLAVLHGNPVGSSQYAEALGKLNYPTGIPLSGPAPPTGNMTAGAGGSSTLGAGAGGVSVGEASSGGGGGGVQGGSVASGGKGGGMTCSLRPDQKTPESFPLLWYTFVVFLLLALKNRRKFYGYQTHRRVGERGPFTGRFSKQPH